MKTNITKKVTTLIFFGTLLLFEIFFVLEIHRTRVTRHFEADVSNFFQKNLSTIMTPCGTQINLKINFIRKVMVIYV